jgi:hypothetical protein
MLLLFDGFDPYTTLSDLLSGPISGVNNSANLGLATSSTTQFNTGKSLSIDTSGAPISTAYAVFAAAGITNTWMIGVSFAASSRHQTGYDIGLMHNLNGQMFCRFILDTVTIYCGDPVTGSVLLTSINIGLSTIGWVFVEIQATVDPLVGSMVVRYNGVVVASATGLNTSMDGTTVVDGVLLGVVDQTGSGFAGLFDDLYISDSSGALPFSAFLGPARVFTRVPNANGSLNQFTPLAAPNWQEVADVSLDGDISYNYDINVGDTDLFASYALPSTVTTVYAMAVSYAARRDDAGTRTMTSTVVSNAVAAIGNTVPLSASYRYLIDYYTTDPATGSAWTVAAANMAQFGYTLVS